MHFRGRATQCACAICHSSAADESKLYSVACGPAEHNRHPAMAPCIYHAHHSLISLNLHCTTQHPTLWGVVLSWLLSHSMPALKRACKHTYARDSERETRGKQRPSTTFPRPTAAHVCLCVYVSMCALCRTPLRLLSALRVYSCSAPRSGPHPVLAAFNKLPHPGLQGLHTHTAYYRASKVAMGICKCCPWSLHDASRWPGLSSVLPMSRKPQMEGCRFSRSPKPTQANPARAAACPPVSVCSHRLPRSDTEWHHALCTAILGAGGWSTSPGGHPSSSGAYRLMPSLPIPTRAKSTCGGL
ncbi:hypothetical protein F4780DRAFT_211295 [Xylariomycetidae sp. FL0641]|nr:hypothetical protein F4780DRAFT_211295 [Xylariomycetidae sp. FL0641]